MIFLFMVSLFQFKLFYLESCNSGLPVSLFRYGDIKT